ncbi:transposase [Scytonema hofmannii PCC 7110]|uniref:Transposase n=3 Tax=Scytonema hofmannii TaxID=34078 RepID=A0A139X4F1_9CYAN|nr:IS4 family transposase [Scytonema hofmannii]KYC34957.1 transposase [Scytonema hofmannii PCC 7110]KYC37463.1 transposase [Scytonema hofmannii PCC 7110]KYC37688.1 transposase [Scytonema hofmannii PCC 7110]KYC39560.1 transposase [Scytonema hofmannii PCC 7110]
MIPSFYQIHLKSQFSPTEYLLLTILINVIQSIKKVSLEALATNLPIPILFESRRKKLQRFLSLPFLTIEKIWFPIVTTWLSTYFQSDKMIYVVIDRTAWGCINLFVISVVWDKRAFPVYFELLSKLGSSNLNEQKLLISQVLPIFKDYKICLLGDREFCSVKLASWLREQGISFCLRLKKNEFIEMEHEIWQELNDLGLSPGISFFLQGVKVTKQKGFTNFNVACKWRRKIQGIAPKEGWFIATNLVTLELAIAAYKRRFDIEEMFRDFKSGGYNLEDTKVSNKRLISLILLIAIAYTSATIHGQQIKQKGVQKYVGRVKEYGRIERRHSSFYIGLYGQTWVNFMESCEDLVTELMRLNRNKLKYYQRGLRAMELILSAS